MSRTTHVIAVAVALFLAAAVPSQSLIRMIGTMRETPQGFHIDEADMALVQEIIAAARNLKFELVPQLVILVLKFLVAPALTWLLCIYMGLPRDVSAVIVVAAATPVGSAMRPLPALLAPAASALPLPGSPAP